MAPFGVVIPVRNGERTIGRTLRALAAQCGDCALHVVVVVNGERDGTRAVVEQHVRELSARGHVCEVVTCAPGRARAIRAGEARLMTGNRLYVDCDGVLSENAVERLQAALAPGSGIHFATPELVIGPSRSRLTRAYFRIWSRLPYVRNSPVTYGVYAVSEEGRRRWSKLPLIHSDDKFVRLHFAPGERQVVEGTSYEVAPPHGPKRLLTTRRRYLAGNRELAGAFPELSGSDVCRRAGSLRTLLEHPSTWPSAAVFVSIYGLAAVLEWLPS
jgi:glycosyltransferase involved in cell wall biosynthesis